MALRYAHYKHSANHKPIEGLCAHWAAVADPNMSFAENQSAYTALADNLLEASTGDKWAAARELIHAEHKAEPAPAKKEEEKPVAAAVEETKEPMTEAAPEKVAAEAQEAVESKQEPAAESKEPAQEE